MNRDSSSLNNKHFDLLICGGGIYGAWTAYDAALRGLSVAIVEQGDWASATSSASSKLIHGGLRYLESFDFKLVKKALTERQMLLEAAPHRVWPLRFGVPVYADSRIGSLQLKAGLSLYDFFAGGPGAEMAHRHFNRDEFAARFPALNDTGSHGGYTYADAQTDDARLVLELIDGALAAGAVCVNYCKLTSLLETDGLASGAMLHDQIGGAEAKVHARQIVYTTGLWTAAEKEGHEWCRLSKGVHLLMPAVLNDEALLLTAPSDGRVFFMIPWYGLTLVGTTDTDYQGDIDHVAVEKADVAYLLAAANHYLKHAWTAADVIGSYAGVRVMKRSDAASPSAVSRDWELKTTGDGVHHSVGGKITSSREDATHIVDAVCEQLGVHAPCATKGKYFPWAPQEDFGVWCSAMNAQAAHLGVDGESAKWLLRRHGKHTGEIFRLIEAAPQLAERIVPDLPFIRADLLWSARNEMAVHLDDLLRRRMPLLILAKLNESELRRLAEMVAPELGWDEATLNQEVGRATPDTAGKARPTVNHINRQESCDG
ncbi:MAG: glycerol-3-phosphate dehydrogenase/oxidase [Nitrosomonadales bacterium]|nr:glycerol-3-phosphate dehydrogenase/oxidase [Nitrosomonadales bacterium]